MEEQKKTFERVSHKLHPVYIVRTMIRSYFGIIFFGFAKKKK